MSQDSIAHQAGAGLRPVQDSARVSLTLDMSVKEAADRLLDIANRGWSAKVSIHGSVDRVASALASLHGHQAMASANISLGGRTPLIAPAADSARTSLRGTAA